MGRILSDEEMIALEAQAPKKRILSDEEMAALESAPPEKSFGMKALEGAGRVMDYGAGVGRTAVGTVADAFTDKDIIQDGDWKKAFKGEAVPGEEMLNRAGIPEGSRVNLMPELKIPFSDMKIGEGDSSMRDVGGFALETAADPLTYLTMGGSAGVKSFLRPLSQKATGLGKSAYKSGLKKIDQEAIKYGKEPVSDLLIKNRIAGTADTVYKKMDNLGENLLKERNNILNKATEAGGEVSMKEAMSPAAQRIKAIRESRDPGLQGMANALEKKASEYTALDPKKLEDWIGSSSKGPTPMQASGYKSSLAAQLPDNAWRDPSIYGAIRSADKEMAGGMKRAVENSVGKSLGEGAKKELIQKNDELGRILTTKEKQFIEAQKENNKNFVTSIDGIILGANNPAMFAAKKSADLLKTTAARTYGGRALMDLGQGQMSSPLLDILGRRIVTDGARPEYEQNMSPWTEIQKKK